MKYFGVTFSDEKLIKTRQRYVKQMLSKSIFDKVFSYGPEIFDDTFKFQHQHFISTHKKGYGYFIWKPYIILKALEQIDFGDILVYGDSGNEMNGSSEQLLAIFNQVNNLPGKVKLIACKEGWNIRWTKSDLYFKFSAFAIINAFKKMPAANRLVFKKNKETVLFVKEWFEYCSKDYKNIDDSPSTLPTLPFFIEHRYDQSVLGILFHLYKCKLVDFGDAWTASRLRF